MSKNETWRTIEFHKQLGKGHLVLEFLAVKKTEQNARRLIDGIIILNPDSNNPEIIKNKDIIVIQTKPNRIGMYLLGQALFSREIMMKHEPRSIKTVAICSKGDSIMEEIAKKYNIFVEIIN